MGLETLTYERFVCDRCEQAENIQCGKVELRARWGHASAQRYQGEQLFNLDYKITLCPNCCDSLRAWSRRGTVVLTSTHHSSEAK